MIWTGAVRYGKVRNKDIFLEIFMSYRRYNLKLTGETPILMHGENLEFAEKVQRWQHLNKTKGGKAVKGDDRYPAWKWMGCLYADPINGTIGVPSDNMMSILRTAATKIQLKGNKTFKQISQAGILVNEIQWPLLINGNTVTMKDFDHLLNEDFDFDKHIEVMSKLGIELFVKGVKIGDKRHIRVRPRFNNWEASGSITVTDDLITDDIFRTMIRLSGTYVGIGDWRPSSPKSGSFGRYTAEVTEC